MTATSPISPAAVRMAGRWRAALAAATCAVAMAGVLTAGLAAPASAAAAKSPWSVQAVPPVDTSMPNAQFLGGSCATATSCVAVGQYVGTDGIMRTFAERWNGSTWRIVNPANPPGAAASALGAVSCASPSSCQAVGGTRKGATGAGPLIAESWTGTRWRMTSIQQPGSATLGAVSCPAPGSCLAVGERTTSSGTDQAVAERWDGHRWTQVTPRRPLAFSELNGVSCPRARDCYAVGWTSASRFVAARPLIEHWTGARWTVLTVARPASKAELNSISCPTITSCTAVGSSGTSSIRMLVEDLAKGKWTESLPAAPSQAAGGTASLYRVSCSAPGLCTALFSYINNGEELTWGIAARGASGGFKFTIPAGDVAQDNANAVSCRTAGCTIVGGLNTNDGQGDSVGTGTPFAWRGSGGHFRPQVVPAPAGTAGGALTSVSCTASGFCAAATETGDGSDFVAKGDPSVLVRQAGGSWTAPTNAGSGFLSSVSCTSSKFCLALGSPAGAEKWDGQKWSELSAPDPFDPSTGGLETVSCVSSTSCLAVGSTPQGIKATVLAARWNGTSWTTLTPARPAGSARSVLAGVSCASATSCVVAGYYLATPDANPRALVETWDGTNWKIGSPNIRVSDDFPDHISVSCASATACMVTWGSFGEALSRWWNGSKWTAPAFAGPTPRSQVTSIYGVSCTSKTACTAVGSFNYSSGSGPLVQNWNGVRWSVTAAPNPVGGIGSFNAVSCASATVCTAVGGDARVETVPFAEVRG